MASSKKTRRKPRRGIIANGLFLECTKKVARCVSRAIGDGVCSCPAFSEQQLADALRRRLTVCRENDKPLDWLHEGPRVGTIAAVETGSKWRIGCAILRGQPAPPTFLTRSIDGQGRYGTIEVIVEETCQTGCHVIVRLPDDRLQTIETQLLQHAD